MSDTILAKIAITTTADTALTQALDRINQNFDGGRVTKTDLASWLIRRAVATLDEAAISEARRAHFNQVLYLQSLVRKLKMTRRDSLGPEELSALRAVLGQEAGSKRAKPPHPAKKEPENTAS